MNYGSLLANLRRRDAALVEIAAAERDFAAIADLPDYRKWALRGRGELCVQRTVMLDRRKDATEFEAMLRRSLELGRQWLALDPEEPEAMAAIGRRMDNLATFFTQDKRFQDAEPLLVEALALVRRIPEQAKIWPPPKLVVSDVLQTMGNMQLDQRDQRALATLTEALALREACLQDFPANPLFRTEVAGALSNVGRVHARLGRDAEALPFLQRAREQELAVLRDVPDYGLAREYVRATLYLLNTTNHFLGRRLDLVAGLLEIVTYDQSSGTLRTAARQWLRALELAEKEAPADLAELRQQYPQKALELLLVAEKKGWGSGNRLDEPIYAPLEDLPEFTALKERLAARRGGDR
jgi:hypothetical protein